MTANTSTVFFFSLFFFAGDDPRWFVTGREDIEHGNRSACIIVHSYMFLWSNGSLNDSNSFDKSHGMEVLITFCRFNQKYGNIKFSRMLNGRETLSSAMSVLPPDFELHCDEFSLLGSSFIFACLVLLQSNRFWFMLSAYPLYYKM